jgi:protein O-mannosyl-transferase
LKISSTTLLRTPLNLCFAALLMMLVVLYLPSLGNVLVFDDNILTSGQVFAEYGNPFALKARSLSYSSFSWLQAVAPNAWWLQRLVNIGVHMAVVALLWAFYSKLLVSLQPSSDDAAQRHTEWALLAGIAWFALNPTAVYGVAYLAQRSILLATFFSVLSLWAVLQAMASQRHGFWLLAVVAYVAAMFSKEYALALPVVAMALILIVKRPSRQQVLKFGGIGVALAAAAVYLLYLRYGGIIGAPFDPTSLAYVEQMDAVAPGVKALAYPLSILNQMWLFFEYGCRWFLPSTGMMSIDLRPPFPTRLTSEPHLVGAVGYVSLLAASLVLMLRYRGRWALLGFCLFTPLVLFVSEFSTVWIQDPFVLYRSYLWAIAVPGIIYLPASRVSRQTLTGLAVVVGAVFLWQATDRIASLRTELTVWNDAVAKLPPELVIGKSRAYLNRGQAFQLANQETRALRDYQRATAFGDGGEGLLNAGTILLAGGRARDALEAFDGAKARGQMSASLSLNRGTALVALGQPQAAFDAFATGLAQSPSVQEAAAMRRQRASAALQIGRIDEALADAQFAAAEFKTDPQIRTTLGFAFLAKGNRAAAIAAFNDAISTGPSGVAHYALAGMYAQDQRVPEAKAAIAKALALQPENVEFQRLQAKLGR